MIAPDFEVDDQHKNGLPRVVLVAGGAGFIGSNLCRRLLDAGDRFELVCQHPLTPCTTQTIRPDTHLNQSRPAFLASGVRQRISNVTLPIACPLSKKACASATLSSGKVCA
ncbi:NAD-dependent epimerase/dehydratase family protein [Roseovarius faecimaris]|uniref:NAD-dependent epimerase/dehydratase family protein n=1 Tax=Roseovarius faecimaris TaxID=2494550 RepID=A0A6I6IXI7_9RHOB|nr:NAD-dependent epimerase/dehydratase family protein [Roseovarius faecimaris]